MGLLLIFWTVGNLLIAGGLSFWFFKTWWLALSLGGMTGLAVISGSFLIYMLYLIFKGEANFRIEGIYPASIFLYSTCLSFYYRKKV